MNEEWIIVKRDSEKYFVHLNITEHFQAGHELALNRLKALSEPVTPKTENALK